MIESHSSSTSELFYILPEINRFFYVFDYGVLVFANFYEKAKNELFSELEKFTTQSVNLDLSEEYTIEIDSEINKL